MIRSLVSLVLIVWLAVGVLATYQRGYFKGSAAVVRQGRHHRRDRGRRAAELHRRQPQDHVPAAPAVTVRTWRRRAPADAAPARRGGLPCDAGQPAPGRAW